MTMDIYDRKLLNLLQLSFPLAKEPFSILARRVGIDEEEVLRRTKRLKEEGILRGISPIIDPRSLGYRGTLVAMRVPEGRMEKTVQIINKHPGVSHNYARDHYFNLWFTLALPNNADLQDEVRKMNSLAEPEAILDLPASRVFKLGVYFDMVKERPSSDNGMCNDYSGRRISYLSPLDRVVGKELEQDLPLIRTPFEAMARDVGMDGCEFLEHCRFLKGRGVIRRFSAQIRHINVGFSSIMACWQVPSSSLEAVAKRITPFREVSHCCERKAHPLFPYNLFTVIHSGTKDNFREVAEKISREIDSDKYILLHTVREFKNERIKYFT